MLNRTVKYSDVLRQNKLAAGTEQLIVIRNTVAEPVFGDYLKYYQPDADVTYTDVNSYITDEDCTIPNAIAILSLPVLAPELYNNLYIMKSDDLDKVKWAVKSMLSTLIDKMLHCRFAVLFDFEYDVSEPIVADIVTWNDVVSDVNHYIYSCVAKYSNIELIDINKLLSTYGCENMLDKRMEHSIGMKYTRAAWNIFAYNAITQFQKLPLIRKKCIILDCDGVLWDGILADDGFEHIKINRNFQREILRLYNEGILICLCSKNNESDIIEVLDTHPDMLLKSEQITAYRINWQNKADNIQSLAGELNLGTDSMVFVDDNRRETELVSTLIKDISVICLEDAHPYEYVETKMDPLSRPILKKVS